MTDYSKLSDREIDALVGTRIMGWTDIRDHGGGGQCLELQTGVPAGKVGYSYVPRYSTDDNAARLVRDRIAELNLRNKFVEALYTLVEEPGSDFNVLQATPRQQAIAALIAKENAK